MLKQLYKIVCCVLMLGLLSIPAWSLENDGMLTADTSILAHGGNGPGDGNGNGGDGPADGSGNGAPDGAGTCPDARINSGSFFAAGGRAGTSHNSSNTLRTRTQQQLQQRAPGTEPAKVRRMERATVKAQK